MADRITITLPDGTKQEHPNGVTSREVAEAIGRRLAKAAVAARFNGVVIDLTRPLEEDGELEILTFADREGRDVYRHTTAHILAQAVKRLFPDVRLGIGPAIEDGFYYDFDVKGAFTPEDLEKIEEEMRRIVSEDLPLERLTLSREEAIARFEAMGEDYKVELIKELPEDAEISCYKQGDFIDLCAGPHLPSTGRVKAFKLLNVAGAYWRGEESRPMLQRIYGTSFEKRSELEEHLHRIEEARRRDHRVLGRQLDLFSIHEEIGPGLVLWHPKGARIREIVENFWREEHRRRGYEIVYTPHIAKSDLWKTSGHWDWYRENMYSPMEVEGSEYLLKPMNCPFHILMYKSETRSYRDLPLRWGELGTVYRYERSGVLHGMLRVRGFTQDDAHIICRPDQLEDELVEVFDLARFMMKTFGYEDFDVMLSVRDPENKDKYIGDDEGWALAERALARALERVGFEYRIEEGEAKFYAPAVDINLKDALGRGWQGPTIQVDFNLPERFDMTYIGEDGREHRPMMIHRTVLGTMERFIGGLIEHYAGAFPTWLAPVQVVVIPITDRTHAYAAEVAGRLEEAGLRVEVDYRNEKMGYKIRQAELQKVPYMLILGDREMEQGTVSVRERRKGDLGSSSLAEFMDRVLQEVREKTVNV